MAPSDLTPVDREVPAGASGVLRVVVADDDALLREGIASLLQEAIVETDNFIEAGTTADPNPPLRLGFVGQCPDGTFSWGFVRPAPTQFAPDLKDASVSGTFANVRDNRGGLHTVSVDARWTGTGPIVTMVNGPGSKRKERSATATATILFDGNTLVNGAANSPFPPPFIRVDVEK